MSTLTTEAHSCIHGQRNYGQGVRKDNGKPYAAWFCPASNDRCQPEWTTVTGPENPQFAAYRAAVEVAKDRCQRVIAEARKERDEAVAAAWAAVNQDKRLLDWLKGEGS